MAAKPPKIFLIILNFNSGKILRDCLLSVFNQDYPDFEVVVVDNASSDGSFEAARLSFGRAHFIRSEENLGFAKGNNLGIRFALEKMADFVLLLNPDAVMEKGTLSRLTASAENHPEAGVFSPLILSGDKSQIWFAGGRIDWMRMSAIHSAPPILPEKEYPTEFISGCAMFVRKEVFGRIGLLDEDYFLYYEDTDFSWRARQAGFRLLIVPSARAGHWEASSQDPEGKNYWLVLSALIFFRKHAPWSLRLWLTPYFLFRKMKNWLRLRKQEDALAKSTRRAYNDYNQWLRKNRSSLS